MPVIHGNVRTVIAAAFNWVNLSPVMGLICHVGGVYNPHLFGDDQSRRREPCAVDFLLRNGKLYGQSADLRCFPSTEASRQFRKKVRKFSTLEGG